MNIHHVKLLVIKTDCRHLQFVLSHVQRVWRSALALEPLARHPRQHLLKHGNVFLKASIYLIR